MTAKFIEALWIYWLVMTAGFIASFGIFTASILRWDGNLWLSVTLAVGFAGFFMMMAATRDIRQQRIFVMSRHLVAGIGLGFVFGLFMYFAVYLVGFFIFYLLYACWILLFTAIIYYAVLVRRLDRGK